MAQFRKAVFRFPPPHGLKIVLVKVGVKHNMEIGPAPAQFNPGDEKFISLVNGKLIFDEAGRSKKRQISLPTTVNSEWNSSSPIKRFLTKGKK